MTLSKTPLHETPPNKGSSKESESENVPAEISEFLVNSLKSHRDGCICEGCVLEKGKSSKR